MNIKQIRERFEEYSVSDRERLMESTETPLFNPTIEVFDTIKEIKEELRKLVAAMDELDAEKRRAEDCEDGIVMPWKPTGDVAYHVNDSSGRTYYVLPPPESMPLHLEERRIEYGNASPSKSEAEYRAKLTRFYCNLRAYHLAWYESLDAKERRSVPLKSDTHLPPDGRTVCSFFMMQDGDYRDDMFFARCLFTSGYAEKLVRHFRKRGLFITEEDIPELQDTTNAEPTS